MNWITDKKWWKLALGRAIRTIAQGAIAGIGSTAVAVHEVNWIMVASCAGFAGIVSILTSIAFGIPEYEGDEPDDN